ncbi:UNVERIFIED_CONTAM: hypothetical protein GTU68_040954 [Idotea baltica]|nr:hypothetical protein [Idotea baltica]
MGFENCTPIQEQGIPSILDNKDLIACAQTGTGKTAAYLLPIIHKIIANDWQDLNCMIIAPTRELAVQIDQQVEAFAYFVGVSSIPVYGGGGAGDWEQQKKGLTGGVNIAIATPGRLIAHLNLGYCKLVGAIHSDLDQKERSDAMMNFKAGNFNILVATDIVSRGIDINGIGMVMNYDVPGDAEDYVHRIGRTGRADSSGIAITLINIKDQQKFQKIEQLIERDIRKLAMPKAIGEGPAYEPNKKRSSGPRKPFKNRKNFKPNRKR